MSVPQHGPASIVSWKRVHAACCSYYVSGCETHNQVIEKLFCIGIHNQGFVFACGRPLLRMPSQKETALTDALIMEYASPRTRRLLTDYQKQAQVAVSPIRLASQSTSCLPYGQIHDATVSLVSATICPRLSCLVFSNRRWAAHMAPPLQRPETPQD